MCGLAFLGGSVGSIYQLFSKPPVLNSGLGIYLSWQKASDFSELNSHITVFGRNCSPGKSIVTISSHVICHRDIFQTSGLNFKRWWLDFTLFRGSTKSLKIWAELLRGFREIFLGMPWGVGHLTKKFPSAQSHRLCSRRRSRWGCRCWSRPQTASGPRWAGDPARRWPPGGDSTGVTRSERSIKFAFI